MFRKPRLGGAIMQLMSFCQPLTFPYSKSICLLTYYLDGFSGPLSNIIALLGVGLHLLIDKPVILFSRSIADAECFFFQSNGVFQ